MNTRYAPNIETDDWAFVAYLLGFLATALTAFIPELPAFFCWLFQRIDKIVNLCYTVLIA